MSSISTLHSVVYPDKPTLSVRFIGLQVIEAIMPKNILPIPTTSPSKTVIDAKVMHAVLAGMISSSSHNLCAKVPLDLHTTTSWQTRPACSQTTSSDWVTNSPTCTSTGRYVAAASRFGFIFYLSVLLHWWETPQWVTMGAEIAAMLGIQSCLSEAWNGLELSMLENFVTRSFFQGTLTF